jgi:hypothetical protein
VGTGSKRSRRKKESMSLMSRVKLYGVLNYKTDKLRKDKKQKNMHKRTTKELTNDIGKFVK